MNRLPKRWVFLLVCVLAFSLLGILGRTYTGLAYAKTSWEYKVIDTEGQNSPFNLGDSDRILNQLGMDGWELVYFIHGEGRSELQGKWIFKRAK